MYWSAKTGWDMPAREGEVQRAKLISSVPWEAPVLRHLEKLALQRDL